MSTPRRLAPVTWALVLLALPPSAGAQNSQLSVELGASSIRPPIGLDGDAARYIVAGLQASTFGFSGSGIRGSFLAGRALDDMGGGDFYSGGVDAAGWHRLGERWSAGVEARAFGFHVSEPYPYRALGIEGGPSIRYTGRHVLGTLSGIAGRGSSRVELRPETGSAVRIVDDDLWRYGATAELLAGTGRLMAGVAGGIHESVGGTYRSVGARVLTVLSGPVIEARVDVWRAPSGTETIAGLALVLPWNGWSMRGFLGRTEPDPLTLAEPSAGAGGVLVGWRLLGSEPLGRPPPPLHEVLESIPDGARVRVRVKGPAGAEALDVLGDFTLWEPRAMDRDGDSWTIEMTIPVGTHHFGFLADGEWYLPENVPDQVSDEWGRKNATLVIEG